MVECAEDLRRLPPHLFGLVFRTGGEVNLAEAAEDVAFPVAVPKPAIEFQ